MFAKFVVGYRCELKLLSFEAIIIVRVRLAYSQEEREAAVGPIFGVPAVFNAFAPHSQVVCVVDAMTIPVIEVEDLWSLV